MIPEGEQELLHSERIARTRNRCRPNPVDVVIRYNELLNVLISVQGLGEGHSSCSPDVV